MAEWSIAPVLKTDVLKGTGGSNPSLSARNQEQRKLLLILFYVDTGSLLTSRHIKQNQHKHRQVVADFLQRSPKQGWASKAKTIIDKKDIIHQAPSKLYLFNSTGHLIDYSEELAT